MNIIQIRQQRRNIIINSISNNLYKRILQENELDYKEILNIVSLNYQCSKRIAKEYLDLAIINQNFEVVDGKISCKKELNSEVENAG